MSRLGRVATAILVVAVLLIAVVVAVLAYVIVGGLVFGVTTSSLDPAQGPSWPVHLVVWSFLGSIAATIGGALLAWLSRRGKSESSP